MSSDQRDFSHLTSRQCSRKELRREKKRMKKVARVAYAKRKPIESFLHTTPEAEKLDVPRSKKKRKSHGKRKRGGRKSTGATSSHAPVLDPAGSGTSSSELDVFKRQAARQRALLMQDEEGDEDAEIRRLEKKLGYNKMKKSRAKRARLAAEDGDVEEGDIVEEEGGGDSTPARPHMAKVFKKEGLDYILEVCDPATRAQVAMEEKSDDEQLGAEESSDADGASDGSGEDEIADD